jgi:NAD-dependent dihydropyrimidine dehydrogenase PreA subunit
MGLFIQIDIDNAKLPVEQAKNLCEICPVEIFMWAGNKLTVRPDRDDECTFCERCLDVADKGALIISKKYVDEYLISRGGN